MNGNVSRIIQFEKGEINPKEGNGIAAVPNIWLELRVTKNGRCLQSVE